MALTPKQQRFVEEYLVDLNATQAAIRAGYSKKTAAEIGAENLTKPQIVAAVAAATDARSARTGYSADRVLEELARIAFFDRRKLFRWGPDGVSLLPSDGLADADAALVVEVSETTSESGGSIRVKTADKLGALRLLGQHLGLFVERLKVEGLPAPPPVDLSRLTDAQLRQLDAILAPAVAPAGGPGPAAG